MDTKIIAVTGKGGVGKTSLSAAILKVLTNRYPDKKILAIDADPAVGLACVLQIEPELTIDGIRREVIEKVEQKDTDSALTLLGEAKYLLYDALIEKDGYAFLAIGRPEAAGCYCKVNTYLRSVISLLAEQFDYVVIDGEAGIEQINRRVMEKVTHLILVTDASKKGCQVIHTIRSVADELVMYEKAGVIVNRLPDPEMLSWMDLSGLELLAAIENDTSLTLCDVKGENVFSLSNDCAVVQGADHALRKIGLLP